MNRRLTNSRWKSCALAALTVLALFRASRAQTIPNPSFEANSFTVAPGFISDNTDITGWTVDNPFGAGLSPTAGDNTFANNGTVPNGTNVAFITGGTTLSTTITGLTSGKVYKITMQVNAATNQTPVLRATVDGVDILALTVYPVSGTAPYEYVAFEFTASTDSAALGLVNDGTSDQAVLVDNLTIAESSGRWHVDEWIDDSTSGVDSQYVYTHAYSFGSAANALINGVPFTGIAGANPAVSNKFSTAHFVSILNGDVNNITGGGAALAKDFIYSGANVASGDYEVLTIQGLTPGTEYVATFYSCAWEDASTTARWATFSVGEDRLTVNQDEFENDNGIRFSYRYTAGTNGTAVIRIAPINPVNVSIHCYGFSNREAVSRNVAPNITIQPVSTVVGQGLPVDFTVSAGGFPTPTYQWRLNGTNIPGATANVYSIASASSQNVGAYDVVIANSVGSTNSAVARLTVGLPLENSSFEADTFFSWPGYSGDNPGNANTPAGPNIPITGWTQSNPENSGINPISDGEAPFADNGIIPHGKQVAFIQTINGITNMLGQTVTGLTPGSQYALHYYENSRAATGNPVVEATLNGNPVVLAHAAASGTYREVFGDVFTADSSSVDLSFNVSSPSGSDTTALIDNVTFLPIASGTTPFVGLNPTDLTGNVGETLTFSGRGIGSLPLSFQWFRNGTAITGATNETLTLTNLQIANAGDYTLKISNSAGSITTTAGHLTINQPIASLFNTGVDDSKAALPDATVDPHYTLVASDDPDYQGPDVSTLNPGFPVGPWIAESAISRWIAPQADQGTGNFEGNYTYKTTFDLTGLDPATAKITGHWAVDNSGTDILLNGKSLGFSNTAGFGGWTDFTISSGFSSGTNTLEFIVNNAPATPNPTGFRVEFLQSNALPAGLGGTGATLHITRDGASIMISWTGTAAGQKLLSAPDLQGPWTEIPNASNPYSTTAAGARMFFRVAQ